MKRLMWKVRWVLTCPANPWPTKRTQLFLLAGSFLLLASAAACTGQFPVPVSEDRNVAVRSEMVSLREGPGLSHPIAAQVPLDTILKMQGRNREGDWIRVLYEGHELWISVDDIDLAPDKLDALPFVPALNSMTDPDPTPIKPTSMLLTVTGTTVNVRTGPGTDFPVRTQVRQGDQLQGLGRNAAGDWVQISDLTEGTELLWIYAPLTDFAENHRLVLPVVATPRPVSPTPGPTPAMQQDQGTPCPLIWADEFEGEGLPNPARWHHNQRPNRWYPDALSFVTAAREANSRVVDGKLIIETHKEQWQGREFTAVRLESRQAWTYGWFEISARLPAGRGIKSAIWMVSDSNPYGSWPGSGEIDIMEFVGYKPGTIHATVHTEAYNHQIGNHNVERLQVPDASSEFHLYALEWTDSAIRIFVDDIHYFTFDNERLQDSSADERHWPFDHPFHIILTISVGGNWAGQKGIDPDIWPQSMELDFMRIYACEP